MELLWMTAGLFLFIWIERRLYQPQRIRAVEYQLKFSKSRVVEGETVTLNETMINRGFLPFPKVVSQISFPSELKPLNEGAEASTANKDQSYSSRMSLLWFQKAVRHHTLLAVKRGVYPVSMESFLYTDALALDTHFLDTQAEDTLIVYPQLYDLHESVSSPHSLFGDHFVQRWIQEDIFFPSGVRDYKAGDNLRFVDWKQTARHQQMKTRTYEYTNSNRLNVMLNLQSEESEESVEDVIRIAATLIRQAWEMGFSIGLYANANGYGLPRHTLGIPPRAYQDPDELFEYLARLHPRPSMQFDAFIAQHPEVADEQALILIVTGLMSEQSARAIHDIQASARSVRVFTLGNVTSSSMEGIIWHHVVPKGGTAIG